MNDTFQERKRRKHDMIDAEHEEMSRSIHSFCEEIRKHREETMMIHEETMRIHEENMRIHDENMRIQDENHRELVETIKSMMNQKQCLPTTQPLPIENSTQNSPIEVDTQSPQADDNIQSQKAIDDNTQSPPASDDKQIFPNIENTQISPAIDNTQISTIIDDTQISPAIENTQIEHPRVIHPPRGSSNGSVCLPRDPPNYPNGRPCILGHGIETVPPLIEEFNHIDSNEWRKSDKERKYILARRATVEYVRLSSSTTPIVKDLPQMDLLELYRVREGLKLLQLAVKINTFYESTESVGGRTTRVFTSTSKEKVDKLLREFVAKSPEVFATYRLLDSSYL